MHTANYRGIPVFAIVNQPILRSRASGGAPRRRK
jgi:hypothetical protein